MKSSGDVPESLLSTCNMLCLAYPSGIPDSDYFPLLSILAEDMSERAIGHVIEICGFRPDRIIVGNDVAKALSVCRPTESEIARVRAHLGQAGYQEWLSE